MSKFGSRKEIKLGVGGTQYCIDAYLVDEVLKAIPSTLEIIGANILIGIERSSHKVVVPNKLKKLGVTYMRERQANLETNVTFYGPTAKSTILKNVSKISEIIGTDKRKAYFKTITLQNNEASVYFIRTTKEIKPDETDLRKKLKLLGAKSGQGKCSSIYAELGSIGKNYVCGIEEVIGRVAICRKA
jgi:hypothetical protein